MILDIVVVLILFYAFYTGYSKGIIGSFFQIFSLLIGLLAAFKLHGFAEGIIQNAFNINRILAFVFGFAITFIVVLAIIRFLGAKLEDLLKFAKINFINKIAGGVFLTVFVALLGAYGYKGLNNLQLISDEQIESSFTYPLLQPLPNAVKPITNALSPLVQDFWNKAADMMDGIKEKGDSLKEG